jgi:3-oxoadipate enol-lactonase
LSAAAAGTEGTQYLDVAGARLRCRVSGTGPAVVFVHGWALDGDMWRQQRESLADRFRVIAYDRRGFGRSSGEPSIERDVIDLRCLLDALSATSVAVVGMSQGARVALRFAAGAPERVRGLVLDGPPRDGTSMQSAPIAEVPIAHYRELLAQRGIDAVREAWLHHPLMRLRTHDPVMRALLDAIVARYPAQDLRALDPRPPGAAFALSDVAMPALVVNGAEDTAPRRAAGQALARALPQATHVLVPAAGHLPNLDQPDAYAALLADFLQRHALPRVPVAQRACAADFFPES